MTGRLNAVFLSHCLTFHLIKTVHLTIDIYIVLRTVENFNFVVFDTVQLWSRGQMKICGLFLEFVAPPGKRNLVAIMAQRSVLET